jgi:hypothetical protein
MAMSAFIDSGLKRLDANDPSETSPPAPGCDAAFSLARHAVILPGLLDLLWSD